MQSALERRLLEAFDELWNGFVDPTEPYYDVDGSRWRSVAVGQVSNLSAINAIPFAGEAELAEIRAQCRALAVENEFAINGHENRISYIVGSGHGYRAATKKGFAPCATGDSSRATGILPVPRATGISARATGNSPRATGNSPCATGILPVPVFGENLLRDVQAVLDEFVRLNKWRARQQEIVRRKDRDGECFLRFFPAADGILRVRFVEPDQVAAPPDKLTDPATSFGVETDPHDVETVLGYWIDGRFVDSAEIQHRKANVDANVKRGLPLFYPVRKNLRRAEKLLRNMSVVSEIQSAIAIIRKHRSATAAGLEQFVANQADFTSMRPNSGTSHFRRFAPGTILDALAGTEYEFPAAGIDAGRYVIVLQAELRAIASRLVMPEFMLSSDASNANYSSTMVAEGPAVKMFERLQHEMIEDDCEVMRRALSHAVATGRLPAESLDLVEIRAIPPTLGVRDRLKDAQADQILVRSGAMSAATMSLRFGLDPEHEHSLQSRDHWSR
ncbi:MAG: phage portal protein [Pirellulales bacterium]|nr:phage portal protein [Pirellulales bacterium]